jgi:hypothetical protein
MNPNSFFVKFQNHRNRAKKEGKVLNRNESDLPLRLCLERTACGTTTTTTSEMSDISGDEYGDDVSEFDVSVLFGGHNCLN